MAASWSPQPEVSWVSSQAVLVASVNVEPAVKDAPWLCEKAESLLVPSPRAGCTRPEICISFMLQARQ